MMRFVETVRREAGDARAGLALSALLVALSACSSKSGGSTGVGGSPTGGAGGEAGSMSTGGSDGTGGSGDTATGGAAGASGDDGGATGGSMGTGGSSGTGGDTGGSTDDGGDDAMGSVDTGPKVLFSFDTDSDFTLCASGVILPPCWLTSNDDLAGATGGTFAPVADEAIAGHQPARAAEWTSTFQDFAGSNRLIATFASNQDWSQRKRLHFNLKVQSGIASVPSFDLFVQGGIEVNYAPIYAFHGVDDLTPEAGSSFVDLAIDFTVPGTDMTVLKGVAGLGIVLRSIPRPDGGVDEAPAPTVLEIDNIWLE